MRNEQATIGIPGLVNCPTTMERSTIFFIGKSTINGPMFNSYVTNYQAGYCVLPFGNDGKFLVEPSEVKHRTESMPSEKIRLVDSQINKPWGVHSHGGTIW